MRIAALEASSPDAVFSFLDASVSPRGRDHWRWKYQLERSAEARAFYHLGSDGSVDGFIGLMPTRLCTQQSSVRAAWFVDWATVPGERSVGAGVGLLRHAQAQTEMLLTLQGSADTQKILPKLRWTEARTPSTWILRLSARAIADRGPVRRRPWLLAPALLAAGIARLRYRVGRPAEVAFRLREIDRFPASYDATWEERRQEFVPLMERTSAQLNFMCADYPGGGYSRFLVLEEERVAGHLILRCDSTGGLARGRIVDALWTRERPGMTDWLVSQACWLLQQRAVDFIDCTVSALDFERALRGRRFSRRAGVPIWYHRLPAGVPTPDQWFITYLDCDRAYR